jgi:hypothetical protein
MSHAAPRAPLREQTERGRWGGRLTSRPLPDADPLLDALAPEARRRLAAVWHWRAGMERRVADSFEVVQGALARRGAPQALLELAERAVDDEYRHTELSRVVASRFAGEELGAAERLALVVPKHAGASPELRDALHVVGQCVLNETTAGAFLEACLAHAEGAVAKTALREILSDEIDHGRIGWAFLASIDAAERAAIGRWLLPMAYTNLRQWRLESPADPAYLDAMAQHGAPPAPAIHAALVDALRALIVPGLRELRVDTGPLEAWLDAGASTDRPPTDLVPA